MKTLAGAALGVLVLAAAAPAFAGGYWDLRQDQPGPPPAAYDGPPCERACPPPEPPCPPPPRHREVYRDEERWQGPPPEAEDVVVPAEFFETEGSVGPAYEYDSGGGGGGFVETGAFGGAESSAFASASASAHVSVDVRVREMQHRMMMRQHQMMMQHHMMPHYGGHGRW